MGIRHGKGALLKTQGFRSVAWKLLPWTAWNCWWNHWLKPIPLQRCHSFNKVKGYFLRDWRSFFFEFWGHFRIYLCFFRMKQIMNWCLRLSDCKWCWHILAVNGENFRNTLGMRFLGCNKRKVLWSKSWKRCWWNLFWVEKLKHHQDVWSFFSELTGEIEGTKTAMIRFPGSLHPLVRWLCWIGGLFHNGENPWMCSPSNSLRLDDMMGWKVWSWKVEASNDCFFYSRLVDWLGRAQESNGPRCRGTKMSCRWSRDNSLPFVIVWQESLGDMTWQSWLLWFIMVIWDCL